MRALVSVSDKTGVVEFCKGLVELGFEIISTGGTSKALNDAGIKTMDISDVTNFPEMLDGRVKTLHPKIHGGLLGLRENAEHVKTCKEHGIEWIDLVVVNLYPFEATIAKPDVTLEDAIENIDIGGPSMLRSASKNYQSVGVITEAEDYPKILEELKANKGQLTLETKQQLAIKVFEKTSAYDNAIAGYLNKTINGIDIPTENVKETMTLRYGENPHQDAIYAGQPYNQLHGKELSFNNIIDIDAAQNIVNDFDVPAISIIKHTNPCGAAIGKDLAEAYEKALACDPVSAFGSIIGSNQTVTLALAEKMSSLFVEAIVAPEYDEDALNKLKEKKNLRIIKTDFKVSPNDTKRTNNGYLIQARDEENVGKDQLDLKTKEKPQDLDNLLFAWKICKHVKSNAIVLAKDGATIGVGAGQMSRIDALDCAIKKAKEQNEDKLKGCVLASDAFFPFRDGVDRAHEVGVNEVIQPGGSVRDEESIEACNEHGMAMVFTGIRHFKH